MKRCCLLIIVVIALAACAGGALPPSTPPASAPPVSTATAPPPTVPVATSTAPVASPEPPDVAAAATDGRVAVFPDTIIVYQREGGFAGLSQKWTFYPTGRIVAGDGTEWQVPADQVEPLFDLVESPGFENLNEKYTPASPCNDCYVHTLTVYGQGEPQTVTFVDGADLPVTLQQTLDEINKLIAR